MWKMEAVHVQNITRGAKHPDWQANTEFFLKNVRRKPVIPCCEGLFTDDGCHTHETKETSEEQDM